MNSGCGVLQPMLWLTAVGLPLALATGFARAGWRAALGRWTPWAALPALLAALWPAQQGAIHLEGFFLGLRLGVDDVGRGFLLFTSLLWLVSAWFAQGYLADDRRAARFHFFWLLAMAGNFALVLAEDMLGFYAGFALMSLSSYGLVIHSGAPEALYAGRIYLALVVLGELLLFAGLVMLAGSAGGVEFRSLAGAPVDRLAALFVVAGFGIKAGALPLHVWLPLAHPAAPVPASAVLSGAMIKAGLLGWLRFLPAGAPGVAELSGPLITAGLAAAFFAAAVGVAQSNPKTVLAYSSISQMGLMTVGAGAALLGPGAAPGAVAAVTLYALHHGLAKGALFLGVGVAAGAVTPSQRRALRAGLLLPALALAGAPWTSGAVAKTALKAGLARLPVPWPGWLDWLLPLAAVGTTLLMARFLVLLWEAEAGHAHRPRGAAMWVSWVTLLAAVAGAAWAWPGAGSAARDALLPSKLWILSWPVLTGALGAWLACGAFGPRGRRRWPEIPAGDLLTAADWAFVTLRRRWPAGVFRILASRRRSVATSVHTALVLGVTRRFEGSTETRLRAWPSVGLLLLLLSGALLLALAW
jgi:formate hydrogenlyase subunit 3/multisubunit Na+/H+ antiporter MnhD subunit